MILWTKEMKALWSMLALGGCTVEKRRSKRANALYTRTDWYVTLPRKSYLNGPFTSKTEAVLYAADIMEIDPCLIPLQQTTKSSRSVSPSAAWSSSATSPGKPGGKSRASQKRHSKMLVS